MVFMHSVTSVSETLGEKKTVKIVEDKTEELNLTAVSLKQQY